MAKLNMANINMVKVNTLIRKGYLLAGVIMAANMFIVNEVRAMEENQEKKDMLETNNDPEKNQKKYEQKILDIDTEGNNLNTSATQTGILATLLKKKDVINLVGTFAVSCLNNYFNLWDYKSGKYLDWKFGFFGWRTKRFLNDYLQFEVNLNVYRGLGWGILHIVDYKIMKEKQNITSMQKLIFRFVTGFISAPLTLHIFNFSIAISIDSIVYGMVEMVSNRWGKNKKADKEEGKEENKEELLKDAENKKNSKTSSVEKVIINNNEEKNEENGETNGTNNNVNGANLKDKETEDDK